MKITNKKGFTLIETLAAIVILGLIVGIAVISVSKYITQSKKKTLIKTISSYVETATILVNKGEYKMRGENKIYALPIGCMELEKGGKSPLGDWIPTNENDNYWAYVLVQYDKNELKHTFGFTFKDSSGTVLYPITISKIKRQLERVAFLDFSGGSSSARFCVKISFFRRAPRLCKRRRFRCIL